MGAEEIDGVLKEETLESDRMRIGPILALECLDWVFLPVSQFFLDLQREIRINEYIPRRHKWRSTRILFHASRLT